MWRICPLKAARDVPLVPRTQPLALPEPLGGSPSRLHINNRSERKPPSKDPTRNRRMATAPAGSHLMTRARAAYEAARGTIRIGEALMVRAIAQVAAACLVLAGCGGTSTTGGNGGNAPTTPPAQEQNPTLETFCTSVLDTRASRASACEGGPTDGWRVVFAGEGPFALCTEWQRGVAGQRIAFDATKTQACLDALKAASCEVIVTGIEPTECFPAIAGKVDPGGACFVDVDCTNENTCDTSAKCPGTCIARTPENAACSETGGVCVTGTSCVGGKCVRNSAQNQSCGTGEPTCQFDLVCLAPTSTSTTGTCQTRATGGLCTSAAVCAPGFACAGSNNPQCTTAKKAGEDCTVGSNECDILSSCVGGKCQVFPSIGGACDPQGTRGEATECLQGFCDTTSGTCVALRKENETCQLNAQCESGQCSNARCSAVCQAP